MSTPINHERVNLARVKAGVLSRAPGVRRCRDCDTPFLTSHRPVPYCPECRTRHHVECRDCGQLFRCENDGGVICPCCQRQFNLF
jgi:hypothetical protein